VWFSKEDERNKALKIPGLAQTNQVGELAAVISALENFPTYAPLTIVSDSKYAIDGLAEHLKDEDTIGTHYVPMGKRAQWRQGKRRMR